MVSFDEVRMPQFATIREVARSGAIPEVALRRLVKSGKCPGFYSGKRFLVNCAKLADWLDEQTASDSAPSPGGRP